MRFTIRRVDTSNIIIQKALGTMFNEVFYPEQWTAQPRFNDGVWWVAMRGTDAAGFSGVIPSSLIPGALYIKATGVLEKYRGHGLQKRMYRAHIAWARQRGYTQIVTETIHDNAASGNSLISCGFRMFNPETPWGDREHAVFWRYNL